MPRLANDRNFKLIELKSKHIEEFFGYQNPKTKDVGMICLRVAEQTEWHYLFLDAGIGFWGKYSPDEMEEIFEEWEDDIKLNLAQKFCLKSMKIMEAVCENPWLSHFRFKFEHGKLIFYFEDQNDIESKTLVEFRTLN